MMLKVPMQPFPLILQRPTFQPTRRKVAGSLLFSIRKGVVDGIHKGVMAVC